MKGKEKPGHMPMHKDMGKNMPKGGHEETKKSEPMPMKDTPGHGKKPMAC